MEDIYSIQGHLFLPGSSRRFPYQSYEEEQPSDEQRVLPMEEAGDSGP
jgi:hypothetical protein